MFVALFRSIEQVSHAVANATTPTMLLRTSPAIAIAKLETDTARKKQKERKEVASAIAKATGLCN